MQKAVSDYPRVLTARHMPWGSHERTGSNRFQQLGRVHHSHYAQYAERTVSGGILRLKHYGFNLTGVVA